jgi:hypothetical protein
MKQRVDCDHPRGQRWTLSTSKLRQHNRQGSLRLLEKIQSVLLRLGKYDSRHPIDLIVWAAGAGMVAALAFLVYVSYLR